jgi:hypothetical protein
MVVGDRRGGDRRGTSSSRTTNAKGKRAMKRLFFGAIVAACAFGAAATTHAEPLPAVDVSIKDPQPHRRVVSIEWNPVAAIAIARWSANLVIVPIEHHALVLNPYYASVKTQPIYTYQDCTGSTDPACAGQGFGFGQGPATQLPAQKFQGFGGEIGYRHYSGRGGPRGFFFGPSFLIGAFNATPQVGSKTSFLDFGVAVDVGYQVLVGDDFSIALGAGLQYTNTSKKLPDQQYPAEVYANAGIRPRFLFSLGWAL